MAILKLSTSNKKKIFNHSSVDGHVVCFHILEIVNNASMNIEVHVPFQTRVFVCVCVCVCVFFIYIPRSGIAGSYGISRAS